MEGLNSKNKNIKETIYNFNPFCMRHIKKVKNDALLIKIYLRFL